ncbi:MAG TPA: hypothetical protein VEY67_02690 [Candidatus Dormibacteraeota bacterium]|nr:hypothetical protein [Candidatus Dormibacteraeota bacterium]
MTEMPQQPAEEPNAGGSAPEQPYEWSGADTTSGAAGDGLGAGSGGGPRATGREWMDQLQSMIDDIATQAAPVVRQIGAKAAELAAVAGEKAGPIAHRAAEATETAGIRLAERSRQLAEDLKRQQATEGTAPGSTAAGDAADVPPTDPGATGGATGI